MAGPWFNSSTPALNQLGATIGYGVSGQPLGGGSSANYTDLLRNIQEQAQREADRNYQLQQDQLRQQWNIARMNARDARERAQADKWYNEQQVAIARDRLALDQEIQRGQLDLSKAQLGYNVLNMASNLRGPRNYYQAAALARGIANDPNSGMIFGALQNNVHLPDFGQQAGVPEAASLAGLLNPTGTGGAQGTTAPLTGRPMTLTGQAQGGQDQSLNQIHNIYGAGAHKLGAGSLENMTENELGLLESGIGAVGGDYSTFLDQYRKSRVGQGIGNNRAA